jgi:XTP/dITP diphosphohydrolase
MGRTIDRLVVCTGNPGKLAELQRLLPPGVELLSLAQAGIHTELPETGRTLEANAAEKAITAHALCSLPCLADDSGLEVDALGGAPGVDSALFAGPAKDAAANMRKLLRALEGETGRQARFRTVLALALPGGVVHTFEGRVEGRIAHAPRGTNGFGYDPLFVPDGSQRTFAEMSAAEKDAMSHRAKAVEAFVRWLSDAEDPPR